MGFERLRVCEEFNQNKQNIIESDLSCASCLISS